MSDLATLSALKARVEAATGPDRELDAEILCALVAPDGSKVQLSPINGAWCIWEPRPHGKRPFELWSMPNPWRQDHASVTGSLDASRALLTRGLPGWSCQSGRSGFGDPAWCEIWDPRMRPGRSNAIRADHDYGSEPLAILSALLTAKIAQMEASHVA